MELSGAGDADAQQTQYITTDDQQQQYIIQGDGADGQSLIQGAKIVDGQLVLPQHYVTDSGETVILVYETPDGGQQFMTEDGQQIVFQQEGAEEGQSLIDPQQIVSQMQGQEQVQGEQEMQVAVSEGQQMISAEHAHIAPGQSLLAPGVTEHSQIAPGQSLLTGQTTFVQENEDGTTTVVSDPNQIAAILAAQQQAAADGSQTVVVSGGESEGMSILSQAVSAIENGSGLAHTSEGQQISVQSLQQGASFPQTVKFENYDLPITSDMISSEGPTTLMADGKEIQVQVLSNADFAASQAGASSEATPETLKLRSTFKGEDGEQIQIVMKTDEAGNQEFAEAQVVKTEDGQVILSGIDSSNPEMVQFIQRIKESAMQGGMVMATDDIKSEYPQMVIAEAPVEDVPVYEFGPGVINPETGDMEEPEESVFQEKEPDIPPDDIFMVGDTDDILDQANAMHGDDEVKLQVEIFNEGSNKGEVTIVSVPVKGEGQDGKRKLVPLDTVDSLDASDDSDFDEENLTPKVVYERLLAQHRRTKECQVCGELLENFLRLKEHLMEHAGYNPCECQKCGRILSTPEGRYRHEKAHEKQGSPQKGSITPQQRVTCTVCGKIIARKEHLKRHMLIHQDCPTYKCLLCGYSFKREDLIKGHVKKFHPKQVEASSLELLFEKSSDETAPERSQWNPHRKYRTTPRPPKVPGRGRGRPRKEREDGDSPGTARKRAPKVSKKAKDIVIKTPDGSVVTPKDDDDEDDDFEQIIIKTADGKIVEPKKRGKREVKQPKRYLEDDEDYDDTFDFDDSMSDEEASQLLVRYAPDDEETNTDTSESLSTSERKRKASSEKPSKTSSSKKAKSAARALDPNAPIWGEKKVVTVSFVGIGEEMKEPYEWTGNEIEEEIVIVMGGKGNQQTKSVKLVKTPQAAKNKALAVTAPGPKMTPKATPKSAREDRQKQKTPATVSRSGRVIHRKMAADGEFVELPKWEREDRSPSKKIHVELVKAESPSQKSKSKSGKNQTVIKVQVSTKRSATSDDTDSDSDSPPTKRTRPGPKSSKKTPLKVVMGTPGRKKSNAKPDPELFSEVKSVRCSTPFNEFEEITTFGTADSPSTSKSSKEERPKSASPKAKTQAGKEENQKSSKSAGKEKRSASSEGEDGKSTPQKGDAAPETEVASPEAEYGTVTIEKGRIVGEITIGKSAVRDDELSQDVAQSEADKDSGVGQELSQS